MRRAVAWTALAGCAVSFVGLGFQNFLPGYAAELDGFAINTQDKAVTVTLFTDQRAQYSTESQGKQFAIILSDTSLSKEQMNTGLPVVIDNKNKFIGRAVPTGDGKVKIILPNLSAEEYTVSVQQKRPGQAAAVAKPVVTVAPRPAVKPAESHTFENIVKDLPKPKPVVETAQANPQVPTSVSRNSTNRTVMRLSTAPATTAQSSNGTIWNPYVVNIPAPPKVSSAPEIDEPSTPAPRRTRTTRRYVPPPISDVPLNTISVAESENTTSGTFPAIPTPPALPGAGNESFANLNALPGQPAVGMPFDNLSGMAKDATLPDVLPEAKSQPAIAATAASASNPFAQLKDAIMSFPKWLLATVALFLGGMGVFTLIGGLVLLRILFSQARQGAFTPMSQAPVMMYAPYMPLDANGQLALDAGKSPYATAPGQAVEKPAFQDKASVNAMDYLKESSDNVSQAVHNAVLLKFPGQRRRTGTTRTQRRVSV